MKNDILALEEQLRQAELGPDAAFFENHLADDALLDGEFAKKKVVAAHRQDGSAKFTNVSMHNFNVIEHGDNCAVVTSSGTYEGAMGTFTLDFMRVWLKRGGKWQIIAGTVKKPENTQKA